MAKQPELPLAESEAQVLANCRVLKKYLFEGKPAEQSYARKRLQGGRCYVVFTLDGALFFGPSRFVGYQNNSLIRHEANVKKHGERTNQAIARIFGVEPEKNATLESAFRRFCEELGLSPWQAERRYWDLRSTKEAEIQISGHGGKTWIFQGNPDAFDVDGYLASWPAAPTWLVTRYKDEIKIGDRVFIWRNQGKQKAKSGVVAEATVTSDVELKLDNSDSLPFWHSDHIEEARKPANRVTLRLNRIAGSGEVLRREWLEDDPILRTLPNLKMQAGTNYKLEPDQVRRLEALWRNTGRDWNRNESLAGLWAYVRTKSGSVSKLPGSPVAEVALLIGRAVGGVYNKVMNFRSIDPTDQRKGLDGAGDSDKKVWAEFFDSLTQVLNEKAIEVEFVRIWGRSSEPPVPLHDEGFEETVRRLQKDNLDELLRRYEARSKTASRKPRAKTVPTRSYERDPLVVAIAQRRSSFRCEIDSCGHPIFESTDGQIYCEVHHITPLAEGGDDTIQNVACLCPSHHREIHHGRKRSLLQAALIRLRQEG